MKEQNIKTIKIFLASSEELKEERIKFGDFIRKLDDTYEVRGFRIKLYKWEDFPSGYEGRPKQDEYNDKVRECDMFVGLFHTRAGQFTLEEYEVAKKTQQENGNPTLYIFCRELAEGEQEDSSLKEFKTTLLKDIRHYWEKYNNSDSLQLQFVMELLKVENKRWNELKVENGNVILGNLEIAKMDNLRFAAENENYVKKQKELLNLYDEISKMQQDLEKKRQRLKKKKDKLDQHPDDEECQEDYEYQKEEVDKLVEKLQRKLDRENELKEDFKQHQEALFNVAKRIAQLQSERITERMRRAVDAFNEGRVSEANTILDEAEADAKRDFADYKRSKEITEQKRENLINSIEELQLKAKTILADADIPIENRLEQTEHLYAQADEMAQEIAYNPEKHFILLMDYGAFLLLYGKYTKATNILQRQLELSEDLYGEENENTALIYGTIAQCCLMNGEHEKALKYEQKALKIIKKTDADPLTTAIIYNQIAQILLAVNKKEEALAYYKKILEINEKEEILPDTLTTAAYVGIGNYYKETGDYQKTLEYFQMASAIEGCDSEQATSIVVSKSMGEAYYALGKYEEAMEQFQKALDIIVKEIGKRSHIMASIYNDIAAIHTKKEEYKEALDYNLQALEICHENMDADNILTARICNSIGDAYYDLNEDTKAVEYYQQAIDIHKKIGLENEYTVRYYSDIGYAFYNLGKYHEAICYRTEALKIMKRLGIKDFLTANINNAIGDSYYELQDYNEAVKYYKKAIDIHKQLGIEDENTVKYHENMGYAYHTLKEFSKAITHQKKALDIHERLNNPKYVDTTIAKLNNSIGINYSNLGNFKKAVEYFQNALKVNDILGIENATTANYNDNLCNAYVFLEKPRLALIHRKKALNIHEKLGDVVIPAYSYYKIGTDCYDFDEYEEALNYYLKALAIQKKQGIEDELTATIDARLGDTYSCLEEYKKALPYYKESLHIYKQLGAMDKQEVILDFSIGFAYYMLEECDTALEYGMEALEINKKLTEDQFDMGHLYDLIGDIFSKKGNYKEALEYHQKALDTLKEEVGFEDYDVAWLYHVVAYNYHDLKEYQKALEYYQKAVDIHTILGVEDSDTAIFFNNIGSLYNDMEEDEKALEYHQKALDIRKRVWGPEHVDTALSYEKIGATYYHLEDYGKALKYYGEALKIYQKVLGEENEDTIYVKERTAEIKQKKGKGKRIRPTI